MNNQEKQEFLKNKIVDGLFALLDEKSIEEMTADEIAGAANVSKRTLYKYYSSKKEMYLALVKQVFMDLAEKIKKELSSIEDDDPWYQIACIGRQYMRYCLDSPTKARLILNYDEMNYITDYEHWVRDIQQFSNQFEMMSFISKYYKYHDAKPHTSIESIALYLWAEAQGMASLIMSKKEWIKEYYKVDAEQLIEEHLELSKKILGGKV